MRVFATNQRWGTPGEMPYPSVLLRDDRWDDFGFKTMFQAELHKGPDDVVELGNVKVMRLGMSGTNTSISFSDGELQLSDDYCSLGQATSYYETLVAHVVHTEVLDYLGRIRDVVLDDERRDRFSRESAFETSLLREGGARRAIGDARELLLGLQATSELYFDFETNVGGTAFVAQFKFGDTEDIPSRINAVIGYNGVGKTQLMANLSHVAWRDATRRDEIADEYGRLRPHDIPFGRVVAISYSAFDTFETPPITDQYVYRGLRDVEADDPNSQLKSPGEIADELAEGLKRLRTEDRWASLNSALAPMLREPSFQTSALTLDFRAANGQWRPVFESLSTGHKISLNIVVQLVSQLENKSLVLIDEPESHLHPPLLAALMMGISEALRETNSFAVIATHSPVVLQEVAARYVQVLRRYGDSTSVERPSTETYGENVGMLTRTVFNLNNAESDYVGVLRGLAVTHGSEGLSALFPTGLPAQALAIVLEAEAQADEGADEL